MQCTKCGCYIFDGEKVCNFCGQMFPDSDGPDPSVSESGSIKDNKISKVAAIAAAAGAIAILATVFAYANMTAGIA